MASPSLHPSAVVDLADSWHRLAGAQQALTEQVSRARDGVAIEPLRREKADAFDVAVDTQAEFLTVRITPHPGRPEKLHVWATPDLLVVRTEAPTAAERLIRLPVPVEPEESRVEVKAGALVVTLARRSDGPAVVWPAAQ